MTRRLLWLIDPACWLFLRGWDATGWLWRAWMNWKKRGNMKGISPTHCEHSSKIYLVGGGGSGIDFSQRYGVSLCRNCGAFDVFTEKNGQALSFGFTLNDEQSILAAGQYFRFLSEEEGN